MTEEPVTKRRANAHRGEIEAVINGERRILCLTLGGLAELETAFGVDDLTALAERFETGRISSRDAAIILSAGLRGGGMDVSADDLERMQIDGGAAGWIDALARLLTATFSPGQRDGSASPDP